MKFIKAYKVFRLDNQDRLRFLFHAWNGSSLVHHDTWLHAEFKTVRDGTNGRYYQSGFHVFLADDMPKDWRKIFKKNDRILVPVMVEDIRPKDHAKQNMWLADWLYVANTHGRG